MPRSTERRRARQISIFLSVCVEGDEKECREKGRLGENRNGKCRVASLGIVLRSVVHYSRDNNVSHESFLRFCCLICNLARTDRPPVVCR